MSALLTIMTLDIGTRKSIVAVYLLMHLCCTKMCVFVDQQVMIAETFAGKHFCQFRLTCINLSSLCLVRNVGYYQVAGDYPEPDFFFKNPLVWTFFLCPVTIILIC